MKIFAETERLILREILPSDIDGMFLLDSDPEVHKYLGNTPVTQRTQSLEVIEFVRKQYIENGIGRWAVIEKETSTFIGWSGLKLVTENVNNHINYYDLGYRFIRNYWGKGYATESAIAALNYGFKELKLNEIYACAQVENIASNKILEKLGFQKRNTFSYFNSLDNWYELKKDNYLM